MIPAQQADRINSLEHDLRSALRDMRQLNQRLSRSQTPKQVYLAIADASDGGDYPATGRVFPIVFFDGSYDETLGTTTLTELKLNETNAASCYNLYDALPPRYTRLIVFSVKNQWYSSFCCNL